MQSDVSAPKRKSADGICMVTRAQSSLKVNVCAYWGV